MSVFRLGPAGPAAQWIDPPGVQADIAVADEEIFTETVSLNGTRTVNRKAQKRSWTLAFRPWIEEENAELRKLMAARRISPGPYWLSDSAVPNLVPPGRGRDLHSGWLNGAAAVNPVGSPGDITLIGAQYFTNPNERFEVQAGATYRLRGRFSVAVATTINFALTTWNAAGVRTDTASTSAPLPVGAALYPSVAVVAPVGAVLGAWSVRRTAGGTTTTFREPWVMLDDAGQLGHTPAGMDPPWKAVRIESIGTTIHRIGTRDIQGRRSVTAVLREI